MPEATLAVDTHPAAAVTSVVVVATPAAAVAVEAIQAEVVAIIEPVLTLCVMPQPIAEERLACRQSFTTAMA